MFSIDDLTKVKNYLPIIYVTSEANQVAKLIILYEKIQKKYFDIKLFFVVSDRHKEIFDYPFVVSQSSFENYKNNFSKEYHVPEDINGDSIYDFCIQNDIDPFVRKSESHNNSLIFLNREENENAKRILERTFKIKVIYRNRVEDVLGSNSIIAGFDSPELVAAGYLGKKIVLFGIERRTNSFRKMFPDTVLLNYNL